MASNPKIPPADPFNTVCEAFISRELTPGCVGADFFAHLGMLGGKTPDGRQQFVWLNGDFSRMRDIVLAIQSHKIDTILIYPLWPQPWRDILDLLPIVAIRQLPNRRNLFKAGPQVTATDHGRIRYPVACAVIVWPRDPPLEGA